MPVTSAVTREPKCHRHHKIMAACPDCMAVLHARIPHQRTTDTQEH